MCIRDSHICYKSASFASHTFLYSIASACILGPPGAIISAVGTVGTSERGLFRRASAGVCRSGALAHLVSYVDLGFEVTILKYKRQSFRLSGTILIHLLIAFNFVHL